MQSAASQARQGIHGPRTRDEGDCRVFAGARFVRLVLVDGAFGLILVADGCSGGLQFSIVGGKIVGD